MNLNDAKSVPVDRKRRTRVGRGHGSGLGKTAGRGMNGAKSRSGWGGHIMREGGQMPLFRRLPKKGFNNANFRIDYEVVNTGDLEGLAIDGKIAPDALKKAGVLKKSARWLKVLGKGDLGAALTVEAHHFSKAAREKIEAAGGTVEVLAGRRGRKARPSVGERHAATVVRKAAKQARREEAEAKAAKKKKKK